MPVSFMAAVESLAGPAIVEPKVEFDSVQESLHASNRCALTCGCSHGTDFCVTTGNSHIG